MNLTKEQIIRDLTEDDQIKEAPIFSKHATKMKYSPFEGVESGKRRCGNCGEIFNIEEFKKPKKGGYDWKCKDCNIFMGVYDDKSN